MQSGLANNVSLLTDFLLSCSSYNDYSQFLEHTVFLREKKFKVFIKTFFDRLQDFFSEVV
jgi:hypothetical protein